jgi:L-xylulose reductase
MQTPQLRLDGKTVIVTGAGKGIGREICKLLVACGAQVAAISRTKADLDSLAAEISCHTVTADLADVHQTIAAGEECLRQLGRIDCLVNNAGISIPQPFLRTTVDAFDRTIAVNVRAALLLSQIAARDMIARGKGGAIVNLSSQASSRGIADHAAYCASKGALDQLTRTMALELGPHQIRVNAINPTVTLTPMGEMAWGDPKKSGPMLARIPLGRFAKPHHVANAVAYLLSDAADMIHGVTLPVDGGFLAV